VDTVTAISFDRHGNRIWREAAALLDSEHARYAVGEVAVPYGPLAPGGLARARSQPGASRGCTSKNGPAVVATLPPPGLTHRFCCSSAAGTTSAVGWLIAHRGKAAAARSSSPHRAGKPSTASRCPSQPQEGISSSS